MSINNPFLARILAPTRLWCEMTTTAKIPDEKVETSQATTSVPRDPHGKECIHTYKLVMLQCNVAYASLPPPQGKIFA